MQPSFSSRFASDLIAFAADRGADRERLTKLTNLPHGAMGREDVRIPCTAMAAVWSAAMEETGDEHIGLKLGASQAFSAPRTTSLIMEASATVREAFRLAVRYSVLIADVLTVELGEDDDLIHLDFEPNAVWRDQAEAVQLDCLGITYISATTSLKRLIGTDEPPALLSLAFPPSSSTPLWTELFGRPVDFGAPRNRIGFRSEVTAAEVATRDPRLQAAIRQYADDITSAFAAGSPLATEVMAAILAEMSPEPPPLRVVASQLGMSGRSLQRVLRAEGHSYRDLVETARMELSERHLLAGAHSVDEVARLAGYADTSSFVRAFKRRTGQPPGQFSRGRG